MLKGEDHAQLMIRRICRSPSSLNGRAWHLANGEEIPLVQADGSIHFSEELIQPGTVCRERETEDTGFARRWHAVNELALGNQVDHVHAEAVDATIDPPVHHVVDRLPYLRVLPVEVRLLGAEQVQVILPAALVKLPS